MATWQAPPPMKSSDEATSEQLQLAKAQGEAVGRAVEHMTKKEAHGRQVEADDYLVGLAVEKAEGLYVPDGAGLRWSEPDSENAHIEVVVRDRSDGRFIPQLNVTVTVTGEGGEEIGTHQHPFLWHPWLYHYGRNWTLPGKGRYGIRVHVEAPRFPRHDRTNGRRYERPVDVDFKDISIETGQKR